MDWPFAGQYIGVGEKSDALEEFHPERMAGRILQMGDVLSLVEKAQEAIDVAEAKKLEKKVRKEGLDLEDFLTAMKQMQKLGPLEGILKMLPGVNAKLLKQANLDPKRMKHVEAIVLSMTKEERKDPTLINGSRRSRISRGSGRPINEVNRLLELKCLAAGEKSAGTRKTRNAARRAPPESARGGSWFRTGRGTARPWGFPAAAGSWPGGRRPARRPD